MEFDELYQEVILDHSRRPRNYGELTGATIHASGDNPSCGDEIAIHLRLNGDVIEDIRFTGQGCAISQASASLMTTKIKGKRREEALTLLAEFHDMLTAPQEGTPSKALGDLRLLQSVRKFPQRVKCATLAWQALRQSLSSGQSQEYHET